MTSKIRCSLLALALVLVSTVHAQDPRSKVQPAHSKAVISNVIDLPKKTIFGIPLGTTEDQFIAQYGPAVGYLRLNATQSLMLYGQSIGFLFDGGKLAGVRLSDHLLDWRLANGADMRTPFSHLEWRLSNGIRKDSRMDEVRRIVGKQLTSSRFDNYYTEAGLRVDMDVVTVRSSASDTSEQESQQRLGGIYIH